ncbi:ion channel protein [Streptomyces sp. NPDC051211]|uniref:ion channel protein n=1 Tax=Streptomyces sp. NPDC051211 TaxID=3154643 RepID=UPI00344E32E0
MTPAARALLPLILPALAVGVGSALLLVGVTVAADQLEKVLWEVLPDAVGLGRYSVAWMLIVLTGIGVLSGLVVWKVYGHAGPDPATSGLVEAPMDPRWVPGLLLAGGLTLAGGVSLGPENPIVASNVALAFWLGSRFAPARPGTLWVGLGVAGTVGALFGTPVAAALVLTETMAASRADTDPAPLWDRLFAPLIAAGAGSLTSSLLAHESFRTTLPDFGSPGWGDLLAAMVVASAAALLGLAGVYAFPYVHRVFHALPNPVLALTAGGVVLGLLGALGGRLTLFKGLDQMRELTSDPGAYAWGALLLMCLVKLVALVVAASAGFRGGRIFPAVFIGVALGLTAHALVPAVHPMVGTTCGVLGVLLATTRQGWLSLFTAAVLAPTTGVLPLLCVAVLPAWLLVTGRPQMQLTEDGRSVR